jgi:1-deoxyxylulose-5-phosphate synthase
LKSVYTLGYFSAQAMPNTINPFLTRAAASARPQSASQIGLGCVTFGREIDRSAAFAMMDHAVAHEITLFDTAAAYGSGASERIVGEWLASRAARAQVALATKVLPPYTPDTMESAVDASLHRLSVESVDLLFLHRWDETAGDVATLRALDGLVCSGRVGAIGASNFSSEQLARILEFQTDAGLVPFRAVQNIHNFAVRGVDTAMREICTRHEIAIITYSPLGAGFLTGKHEEGVQAGSRFDIIPGHQDVYFNELSRSRLARLRDVASRTCESMIQLALAWALHQPQVATVLVGGRTTAHLDQARQAQALGASEILRELDRP